MTATTVPETPSPQSLAVQQEAAAAGRRALLPVGPGRHVDNTPSKGRASKAQKLVASGEQEAVAMAPPEAQRQGTYGSVVGYAERLFGRIRLVSPQGEVGPCVLTEHLPCRLCDPGPGY